MKPTFDPKISFDGVAIIIGVITMAIWMGRLSQKVEDTKTKVEINSAAIRDHERLMSQFGIQLEHTATILAERGRHLPLQTPKEP